jgi:16S rRNA (guanine527-N7)-methyltransferase
MPLTLDFVKSTISAYYSVVSNEQCDRISKYIDLLTLWNRKISLTSVVRADEILRFHFGESIFALKFCNFSGGRLADVGSGAGFPGLAIKIFCPDVDVILIEPNLKKYAFLAEVVRKLDLKSVQIISRSFENAGISASSLQFVTSRALSQTAGLISWSESSLAPGGSVVLWVSKDSATRIQWSSHFVWDQPKIIPETKTRTILVGYKRI